MEHDESPSPCVQTVKVGYGENALDRHRKHMAARIGMIRFTVGAQRHVQRAARVGLLAHDHQVHACRLAN